MDSEDREHEIIPGMWRGEDEIESIRVGADWNSSVVAKHYRDALAEYSLNY